MVGCMHSVPPETSVKPFVFVWCKSTILFTLLISLSLPFMISSVLSVYSWISETDPSQVTGQTLKCFLNAELLSQKCSIVQVQYSFIQLYVNESVKH
jgi:hypothetical protein